MSKPKDTGYCDRCGEIIPTGDACVISHLPIDITSANVGESAIVCADCYILVMTTETTTPNDNNKHNSIGDNCY